MNKLKPAFSTRRIFSREAKNKSWQSDWSCSEKIRREKVGSVPTSLLFARTNSPSGERALGSARLLARVLKEGVQFWYDTSTVKGGGGGGGRENVPLENL